MKKNYEKPEFEIIKFETADIIVTSPSLSMGMDEGDHSLD